MYNNKPFLLFEGVGTPSGIKWTQLPLTEEQENRIIIQKAIRAIQREREQLSKQINAEHTGLIREANKALLSLNHTQLKQVISFLEKVAEPPQS